MQWHQKTAEETLKELKTGKKGLKQGESALRLRQYGPNIIPEKKKETALQVFLEQFKNFLVIILIVAAVISIAIGEVVDAAAIILIVVLNAIFGFIQERKAERALEALKKMASPKTHVLRDGKVLEINASDVVIGDLVTLEVGDKIPADCRIFEETNLKIDESILTGESTPVFKSTGPIGKEKVAVADQKNMLFSGTTVVYGRCKAVVTSTGTATEFGKIAKMLEGKDEQTPLQKKLEVLGKQLGIIILVIAAIVFAVGLWRGVPLLEIFLTSVSLAVAAIPEGLPAVVTITLSVGLLRMARKNAIIRKLPAVETLGSTTVVCSDKTGTLTKNEMTVRKLYVNEKIVQVTGEGYATRGTFLLSDKEIKKDDDVEMLLTIGMMCNNANLEDLVGDPTEIALLASSKKFGLDNMRHENRRVKDIEFDSERKMMSTAYKISGKDIMYTKGAVESVLDKCGSIYKNGSIEYIRDEDRKNILKANSELASNALRVLAFATKRLKDTEKIEEKNLIFVGLQGMIDPPRPEAKAAIATCKEAGIKVVMITGDHRDTAAAVAKELSLMAEGDRILTGEELDDLNDEQFLSIVKSVSVYARVSPEHKVRITDALKKKNHIVAMTGDGINDAPALKKADIGISMGIKGTDVAKEASDMVLADDNFASIVSAIEEGRGIFDNVRKFIAYLLACNIGEVMVVFTGLLIGFPLVVLPVQLLWINLVTDGLPALALGVEPYEKDIMKRKPKNTKEKVLNRHTLEFITVTGMLVGAATLYFFWLALPDVPRAQTIAFTALVMFEMAVALSMRSPAYIFHRALENKKLLIAILSSIALQVAIVYVPFLNPIFDTVPLTLKDWAEILVASFFLFVLIELNKIWKIERHVSGFFVKHETTLRGNEVSP